MLGLPQEKSSLHVYSIIYMYLESVSTIYSRSKDIAFLFLAC
ncbi:hypothetical protein APHMUC_0407 [Anaplasma phagocytophilum str. ApMUC09]|uniref:Uncharacterized protein n=1 Tax=Anaplasma phagocytophilum str. ApMUC09 TaxID=1359152 RepID=A0A0F3N926_ANAPH|nr:hypothetical protein APHMUC_0407 [Anaplasma phagocytophilum str. ApMUC09]